MLMECGSSEGWEKKHATGQQLQQPEQQLKRV